MCFTDVDGDEFHLLVIFSINVCETYSPFNVGRSGEAAKYQGNGLFLAVI